MKNQRKNGETLRGVQIYYNAVGKQGKNPLPNSIEAGSDNPSRNGYSLHETQ